MQTKLHIFKDTPTYSEIVCKRVVKMCDNIERKDLRRCEMVSIKDIIFK